MGETSKFERVRVLRGGQWFLVDTIDDGLAVIDAASDEDQPRLATARELLNVAADAGTNENVVAARSAFIAAMKDMGWLHDAR